MLARVAGAIGLGAALLSGTASAAIIGQEFTAEYRTPDVNTVYGSAVFTPTPFIAGPGVDTTGVVEGVTRLLVDLYDTGLTVQFQTVLSNPTWNAASFNGIVLTAAEPLGLSGATVDAGSTLAGFDASRVTLTSDQIELNWGGLSYHDGTVLAVSFAAEPVPEPASLAVLGVGLLGLGLGMVGRRKPV